MKLLRRIDNIRLHEPPAFDDDNFEFLYVRWRNNYQKTLSVELACSHLDQDIFDFIFTCVGHGRGTVITAIAICNSCGMRSEVEVTIDEFDLIFNRRVTLSDLRGEDREAIDAQKNISVPQKKSLTSH